MSTGVYTVSRDIDSSSLQVRHHQECHRLNLFHLGAERWTRRTWGSLPALSITSLVTWRENFFSVVVENSRTTSCMLRSGCGVPPRRWCGAGTVGRNGCFLRLRRCSSNGLTDCCALVRRLVCHRLCSTGSFRVKSRRIIPHSVSFCPSNFLALAALTFFFSSSSAHWQGIHLRKLHLSAAPTQAGLAAGDASLFVWLAVRHLCHWKIFPLHLSLLFF